MARLLAAVPDRTRSLIFSFLFAGAIGINPEAQAAPSERVLAIPYSGIISPVASEYIVSSLDKCKTGGYEACVLLLDTPGGLDVSMRVIVKAIMASRVPIIVYISPQGARAASAGVFITMAAHVAAMAPGTNIGAAHPLAIPAGTTMPEKNERKADSVLEGKMVNDAAAYLQSIAKERGRNEEWAFKAVTQSVSITAAEALKLKVVDVNARSLDDLLAAIEGMEIPALKTTLHTAGAAVNWVGMTRRQRILSQLSDPNVAMILMSLGAAGLLIELYSPGLILPGIVGAISLILAFYSFETLSANYAGVLLLLFGMVLFVLEIKVSSYGLLAIGAVTSILLGSLILFRQQTMGGLSISWSTLAGTLGGMIGVTAYCSYLVIQAQRLKPATGAEAMIGMKGIAAGALSPRGKVRVQGELWDAESLSGSIEKNQEIVVREIDGLTLRVQRLG